MLTSASQRRSAAASLQQGEKKIRVYDLRLETEAKTCKLFEIAGRDFNDFLQALHKEFGIPSCETFVVATTDRIFLNFYRFKELQDGTTLHLLQHEHQVLPTATVEKISFMPHYNILIKSGIYEYYASENKASLAYPLAELIDNSLSATAKNTGTRIIEIRMLFDESLGKPAVIVLDNGCGMTTKQLNKWAVYGTFARRQEDYVRPDPVPRSLNSDMSYFGVGGKQAVFHFGNVVRMISKPVGLPDVHELVLSEEEFERKEKNKEDIYSTTILNRKPGDSSHVSEDERFLRTIIDEERGKESFTAVVITGLKEKHISFLKENFDAWTRHLAHIYHYYIHGINGNDLRQGSKKTAQQPTIDIQITLREKPNECPRVLNLREVDDDLQTLYINSAADTFEFKASAGPGGGTVEGVLRYHPFLYDKETYPKYPDDPKDPKDTSSSENDNLENEPGVVTQEERKIFECFWNGRLIPGTKVAEFDWCSRKHNSRTALDIPPECYRRLSGVLFTDDNFQVTINKMTFMDLELKLKNNQTVFSLVQNGQKSFRGNIQKEFTQWLRTCNENFDKQIKFVGFKEIKTRTDVPTKKMQHPWAVFSAIEWGGKTYKTGQLVKTHNTNPILYGKVVQFLLYGNFDGDVYATGGQVEVSREPKALWDMNKIVPISKIDKTATDEAIKKNIDSDSEKLPDKLNVEWPNGNPLQNNAILSAGTTLGPLKIEILNKRGEKLSRMSSVGQGKGTKLCVKLTLLHHGLKSDKELAAYVAPHLANTGFWFKKMDHLTELGKYTLNLNTVVHETNDVSFGGRALPRFTLKFTIKEGEAASFDISAVSPTLRVGVPFDIPLQIKDGYGHSTTLTSKLRPELKCCGLDLSYETFSSSGTTFTIKSIKARGKVLNYQQSKSYDLEVTLPGLKQHTKSIKISLLPGIPHSLHMKPEETSIDVENGDQVKGFPPVVTDCSSTGAGQLVTKPINLKIIKGEQQELKAQFVMPSYKNIPLVMKELRVLPSTQVSVMELYSQDNENLVLRNSEKIKWIAGGLLQNLFYKLYDEAGREVPLTAEIASMIKVNWTGDVFLEDLVQGKLPDLQVPKRVGEQRFYQVSYQDQSVSVSFTIVPRPDEPERLKVALPQTTVKLGEILSGNISLELVDQFDNLTKTLTPSCVNHIKVEAEGLDKSAITFKWQESSCAAMVTGIRFESGSLGPRELRFSYSDFVERVSIKVTAGLPAQLKLISAPEQPLQVLNDHGISKPFVVQLCDDWGNPSPDQRVVVDLKTSPPGLTVKTNVISQPVNAEGKASFVVNGLSGPKGCYQLQFKGSFNKKPIPGPSVSLTVLPDPKKPVSLSVEYDTSVKFLAGGTFRDAQNQQKMSELTRKKDELSSAIEKYNETFRTYKELFGLLTASCLNASKKEADLKNELCRRKVKIPDPISAQHIDALIKKKSTEAEAIQKMSRRVFPVRDNFRGQAEVLGMVGHLALVQDDAAAWVISWHIRGDMDCVITKTTEAAQRISRDTQGRQQVMALDSVLVSPGNRPLPHIRNGYPLFEPHGNPVYAREMLIYPCDPESCDIVFKNILGDTILIDDLESAKNYRTAVVQNRIQCPTILTRQGDRVSSRGKFGGAQNRAPPMATLHMFGAPLPQQYHNLMEQIDLLRQYCSAVSKREEIERERDDHVKKITSPNVQQKEKDLEDKKRQLREIEKELASASAKGMKRGAVDGGQPSSSISKRARQSST
ncbi:structural maintenance of chromosomes flexible hinge domain-containing protein 1 isoform X2 [Oreochromis niloticus]|uniref:structural maintenance of chromosomes flexible hinge domain-containing protein 1 isoform X2 n=1 Tax=Oreochromis niloticus TaxID=8128 RepID=UPI0009047BBB|nr:structural maintenance of chromosomes flexible hinge domain-containing protein 1 isoform X2 [Oreochromis niloticus]